jgi:type II secretory pathway component GspD/PulD (secretin)
VKRQGLLSIFALLFLGACELVAAAQHVASPPSELPVVTLDGFPATLASMPQRPAKLPSMPVTVLDERGLATELDAPRSLSLTFARPLPIRDVLILLFRGTHFSVVVDPEVKGPFVGELKDVTLRQALESVLVPAGFDYQSEGGIVRVFPRKPQTRFFGVDHLAASRAGADFFVELGGGVQALLSSSGKSHVNRKASLVQVTDFADRLDLVAAYLEAAHLRVNRQVRIHARVFEVTRADSAPVDWVAVASRPGSGVRPVSQGAAAWRVDDFDAWLRTIAEVGAVRHIASPSLLAMNNEPALLRAEDPAAQSELSLSITAQIAADRIIHLHVAPSYVDRLGNATPAAAAGLQFKAAVDTVVRIADGDTVLIGGVLRRLDAASHGEVVVLLTATTVAPGPPLKQGDQ